MSNGVKRTIYWAVVVALIVSNGYFVFSCVEAKTSLADSQRTVNGFADNGKIIAFTKLFIEKVLKAEQEISFEDRLQLENGVRELGDASILAQWKKFTDSKTESDAQREVKNLLEILVDKIATK